MSRRAITPRKWLIHLSVESKKLRLSASHIKKLITRILGMVDSEIALQHVCEINLLVTTDKQIRVINQQFRKKDKATDVLSFPQYTRTQIQGRGRKAPHTGTYLGDLVVSAETTIKQAALYGVSVQEEFERLVVHGILHLLGYDHEGVPKNEAARMRRREKRIRELLAT